MKYKQLVREQHRQACTRRVGTDWLIYIPPSRTLGMGNTASQAWRDAAMKLATKSRSTVRARIDQLIDWHIENRKPCPPIRVQATPNTIRKFARKRRGHYRYRDHLIIPIRASRTRAEIQAEKIAHAR